MREPPARRHRTARQTTFVGMGRACQPARLLRTAVPVALARKGAVSRMSASARREASRAVTKGRPAPARANAKMTTIARAGTSVPPMTVASLTCRATPRFVVRLYASPIAPARSVGTLTWVMGAAAYARPSAIRMTPAASATRIALLAACVEAAHASRPILAICQTWRRQIVAPAASVVIAPRPSFPPAPIECVA